MGRWAFLLALLLAPCARAAEDGYAHPFDLAQLTLTHAGKTGTGGGGPSPGQVTAITIPSVNFLQSGAGYPGGGYTGAVTDLPLGPIIGSMSGDVTLATPIVPANNIGLGTPYYDLGTDISPALSFQVARPAYSCTASTTANTCSLGTANELVWARGVLRQPTITPTQTVWTAATELLSPPQVAVTWSDNVFAEDVCGNATSLANFYTNLTVTSSLPASSIPVTCASPNHYPQPLFMWDMLADIPVAVGSGGVITGSITVAARDIHAYARGGVQAAAHVFKLYTASGTLIATHTVTVPALAPYQWQTICTGTQYSATLTACGTTAGLWQGDRLNVVAGSSLPNASTSGILYIPGAPEVIGSALTATAITMGQVMASGCAAQSDGSELITATPGDGEALADGAYAGATITDANLTGGSVGGSTGNAIVVTPTNTSAAVSAPSGLTATLTLSGTQVGQFNIGNNLIITGIAASTNIYISAKSSATVFTITCVSTCPTISGAAVKATSPVAPLNGANSAGQAHATATSVRISTNATGGSGTGGCTINHIWQGATGSVVVTVGPPEPDYATTFTAAEMASITTSQAGYVEDIVYPARGKTLFDTQSGGSGVTAGGVQFRFVNYLGNGLTGDPLATAYDGQGCDSFYPYATGLSLGSCDSTSGAWFPANGQAISPNMQHNLEVYFDPQAAYVPPLYVFIGGSEGATCIANPDQCVYSSPNDPGATGYWSAANTTAMLAAIKACNGNNAPCINSTGTGGTPRGVAHGTDINGVIMVLMPGGSPYSLAAANVATSVVTTTPGIVYTEGVTSGTAVGWGCNQSTLDSAHAVTITSGGTNKIVNNICVENLKITNTSGTAIAGTSNGGVTAQTAFLGSDAFFNGDNLTPGATAMIATFGNWQFISSYIDEAAHDGNVLIQQSGQGQPSLLLGSTVICGSNSATVANMVAFTTAGNDFWNCRITQSGQPVFAASGTSIYKNQPLNTIHAFDRFNGVSPGSSPGHQFAGLPVNVGLDTDVFELINNTNINDAMNIGGDEYYQGSAYNVVKQYISIDSNRLNQASTAISTAQGNLSMATVNGNLNCTSVADYYIQISANYRGAPSTESSVFPANTGAASGGPPLTTCASASTTTGSITVTLPPDDQHLFNVYVGTAVDVNSNITGGHLALATVNGSTVTATQLNGTQTILVTGLSTAQNPPAAGTSFPQFNSYKSNWYDRGNIYLRMDNLWDGANEVSGINNGGRIGGWPMRFYPGSTADAYIVQSVGGPAGPGSQQGELVPWAGTTSAAPLINVDATFMMEVDAREYGGFAAGSAGSLPQFPSLNIGRKNECWGLGTTGNVPLIPSGYAAEPWDIHGLARLTSGTGWAGPDEKGCN